MNSETPFPGRDPDGGDAPYEWLDEWLCEYVDGTMDPSLEAVFEQYVEANPDLKAHVERLKETRELLCECGLPNNPSSDLEAEICTEVECDMMTSSTPLSEVLQDRPVAALGMVSSVAVALVIGFLVGAATVDPTASGVSDAASSSPTPITNTDAPSSPSPTASELPFLQHSMSSPAAADSAKESTLTTIGLP